MSTVQDAIPAGWENLKGTERSVGGNTPFLLSGADRVWLILSGRVEVFCVAVEDEAPAGPRYHYLTADPGDALFGVDLDRQGEGLGLLGVGVVGTRLLEVSLGELRDLAGAPALVERWVTGLSKGVSRTIVPPPRADLLLEPGGSGTLEGGARARAHRGVVWVRHLSGSSVFVGMEELTDVRPEALFPVTVDSFLQALDTTVLAAIDTGTALASEEGWQGLDQFYGAVFRCEFFNTRLAAADELNRLKEKAQRDQRSQETALAGLVAVLDPRASVVDAMPGDDPLLTAISIVARRVGFTVERPRKPKEGERAVNPLTEIVRASRIRMRKVVLKGEWWTREAPPMLAYVEDGMQPVAILPKRAGRFELMHPQTLASTPVTPAVARTLAGAAYTFYRPFPDKKLKPLDLFRFGMRGNRADLIRPLVVGVLAGLLALVPPYFMGLLVDTVIPEGNLSQLYQLAILLVAISVTTATFTIVRQVSVLRLETKMSAAVQPAMWNHLLGLPTAFFRQFAAGDLAQRVSCIDSMRVILSGATMSSLMTSIFSVFLLGQLFYYSWQLALLATGLVAFALGFTAFFGWLRLRQLRPVMEIEGKISGLVLQLLTGIAKLRVAGAETRAFAVWARYFAQQKRLSLRSGGIETWVQTYNIAFPTISLMPIFWVVLWLAREALADNEMPLSAGDFIAFNTAFGSFLMQMLGLGTALMSTLGVLPLFERAEPILSARREVDDSKSDPGELSGRIDVEHVSFRYHADGPRILDNVSIHAEPGMFIALVGPSGSGKSTLARLLLGLETPESGSIFYDGRDISLLDVQKVRHQFGVVMQTGKIRAGSLLDNIVGSTSLGLDEAWEAVRLAGFEADVKAMPMEMQTVLQQGGPTLSGGQRQRLMIARAIVNKPRIIIFDEATSALDNRTQAIVTQSLEKLQATRIAIAHRLSTIVGADRIYVLKDGRVVQSGTYEELAAQDGPFAELIKRQVA